LPQSDLSVLPLDTHGYALAFISFPLVAVFTAGVHFSQAFLVAPVVIVILGSLGLAATLVVVCVAIATTSVGTVLSFVFAFAAPLGVSVIFSIMAFLRLFVLFPSVWEELYHFAAWFATFARVYTPYDILTDERLKKVKAQVFKLYDRTKDSKADLLDSTVKYLFVEFLLEAVPQLIIQVRQPARDFRLGCGG
jgi:hypothetical protein